LLTADNPAVDPVIAYFLLGLVAGVGGSFLAARLARVDRLWALPDKPDPRALVQPIGRAARVYHATGPSGLVAVASSCDHPLLGYALRLVVRGEPAVAIRRAVSDRLAATHRVDRRCQFVGRLLGQLAPVLGISGMAGAMYLGLSRLQDPTGSVAGLAISVMLLMVGGNLIAMFGRRLSRATPPATIAGQVAGAMIIEGASMIRDGSSPTDVERRLLAICDPGPADRPMAQAA